KPPILRDAHQTVEPAETRAGIAALVCEVPWPAPESARQRNLGAVPSMKPCRGLLGHRIEELIEVQRVGAPVGGKDLAGCGRPVITDDFRAHLVLIIHDYLLRQPILSPGGAFLVRSPQRTTASTPSSLSLARSPGGLRSRLPRYGNHE